MKTTANNTYRKYVCASERIKCIGSIDGLFPDFGHHLEKEMGGIWLHPIKLLDGFWLRFHDLAAENVNTWIIADRFENRPEGNRFFYRSGLGHTPVTIERDQLAPEGVNGLLVTYSFSNTSGENRPVELEFLARTDLRPVWFSQTAGIRDGERDEGAWAKTLFHAKDCAHEWHVAVGANVTPDRVLCGDRTGPQKTDSNGVGVSLFFSFSLAPDECRKICFYIAGSYVSQDECLSEYGRLLSGQDFFHEKEKRYEKCLGSSRLQLPDKWFTEVYDWIKVNTDWLIQDSGPYGRGLTAGLPEYPWWFGCDSSYALQGVLAAGDFELCRDTLSLLLRYSEKINGNGRIVHEVTTHGVCVNPGNTQETAHFIVAVFMYYQWSGDVSLLEYAFPYLQKSVAWLETQDIDGDLFPSGYGIIEIAGLRSEMIDTAVYTCEGYACYAKICRVLGKGAEANLWQEKAEKLKDAINDRFWDDDEGIYCDAYTSYPEVMRDYAAILEKVPDAIEGEVTRKMEALLRKKEPLGAVESGWLINRNWIIATPMEAGIAPRSKAQRALSVMHTPEYIGRYGMYLNALYHSATMTISTGAMAVAQARYGNADRALELIERMFSTFGMATPGGISEMSPDEGCFVQAWTIYAALVPIVMYFFGIMPQTYENRVVITSNMPSAWHNAELQNVHVPGGNLTVRYTSDDDRKIYTVEGKSALQIVFHVPDTGVWIVNGQKMTPGDQLVSI